MMKSRKFLDIVVNVFKSCRLYNSAIKDHPYYNIHPWKTQKDLSRFLLKNIIYNHDGLVAVNKPYGIPVFSNSEYHPDTKNKIVNSVQYSVENSLEYLARKLNYDRLEVIQNPERYMSGVTLLSGTKQAMRRTIKAINRAKSNKICPITYWIVTTKLPRETSGFKLLAIGKKKHPNDPKLTSPALLTEWSNNQRIRDELRVCPVDFKLLSNSTDNLSSLIEVSIRTRKCHALRLFAADILHSPILGDNIYGYLIQKVYDSYVNVGPFSELKGQLPKLNSDLLKVLNLKKSNQEIIPVHIHMRKINLYKFKQDQDLVIEASPMREFQWTCDRLNFKYLQATKEEKIQEQNENEMHDCMEQMVSSA